MVPAVANAGDTAPASNDFVVKSSTDAMIKLSVKAFNNGEYERSIAYSQRALDSGLSKSRKAVAQNNLCAANAVLGQMDEAAEACNAALELRPEFEPAQTNKAALTVLLAQN